MMLRLPYRHCVFAAILLLLVSACAALPAPHVPAPPTTQSQFVALDIDATLTPHNLLVFQPRPDAANVLNAFASKGYALVYVTTRVPGLQSSIPSWLKENGFPAGNIHAAQTFQERSNAADFKLRVLSSYIARGWRLSYAFGDSPTDFIAYKRAGLPKERVFALKRKWRDTCEEGAYNACLDGWTEYLKTINVEAMIAD
jgi:hypothetical protein